MRKFFMGARDQIGFWGAIQHFIRENIQKTCLEMRELLESLFREHGTTDPPWGASKFGTWDAKSQELITRIILC